MGIWKDSPRIETEIKEESRIDLSLFKKKGNSKTFPGYCIQKMKEARDNNNPEVVQLIQHFYKKYMEFEKEKSRPLIEIEIVEGWKGVDKIEVISGFENDFVIKSHTKDKKTGKVTTATHQIPHEKVNTLFFWIKKWKVGESHKCYEFATQLGYSEWKDLWSERKEYFDDYYFPIKVLESLGMVEYSGRGEVTRLK